MITTDGLRKSFRTKGRRGGLVDAVRGIDLAVAPGEIFGLLGPNGAGKTTTLRMLATLIEPDGGQATVAGVDLRADPRRVRRLIGYVAQGGGTWDEVTAREELVLQARLYGLSKAEARRRADAAVTAFQLEEFGDRWCKTYSGGQRRRVDIALGVVHEPRVVLLDEPTTGLDPQSRAAMWEEIRRLREGGVTVLITTHYLDEADALCDRVAIVDHGVVVAEGTPDALKREITGDLVTIGVNGAAPRAVALLEGAAYVRKLEPTAGGLRLHVDDGATALPQIMRALAGLGDDLGSIEVHRPSLDDVFLTRTGRSLRDS